MIQVTSILVRNHSQSINWVSRQVGIGNPAPDLNGFASLCLRLNAGIMLLPENNVLMPNVNWQPPFI